MTGGVGLWAGRLRFLTGGFLELVCYALDQVRLAEFVELAPQRRHDAKLKVRRR